MFGFFKRMFGRGELSAPASERASGPVIAFVTLPQRVPLRTAAVLDALRKSHGIDTREPAGGGDSDSAAVDLPGGGILGLGMMPAPIPWTELEGPCATAWHWPEAAEVMQAHRAHVIVTVLNADHFTPVERSLLASQAAAAVAEAHGATGVYWGNGTVVNPADRFIEMTRSASAEDPPLLLWVEVRYARNDDGSAVAFTTGMESLGHKEFEIRSTSREPGDVIEMLLDLCLYVLRQGPVLLHGQTFGRTAEERMKIRHGPSMHDGRGTVIRLEM